MINAHKEVYEKGNASKVDANSMGAAAALQVLKQFTSSGSSSSDKASKSSGGGNTQTQLISLAMAEATKMFDKSGGAKQGDKQDAVNSAAMTIMKLLIQSKFSGGTTGGKDSGGLGSLVGMVRDGTPSAITDHSPIYRRQATQISSAPSMAAPLMRPTCLCLFVA